MDANNCKSMPFDLDGDGIRYHNVINEIASIVPDLDGDGDPNHDFLDEIASIADQFSRPSQSQPPPPPPWVEMYKQPQRLVRFRYSSEQQRQPQVIHNEKEDSKNEGWPSIRILNCTGLVTISVCCVTHSGPPFRKHPNLLVSYSRCKDGVYSDTKYVTPEDNVYELQNVGISNINKRQLLEELSKDSDSNREIEIGAVRLAFSVLKDGQQLNDVYSNIILDEKTKSDLIIKKLSHTGALIDGATSTFDQPQSCELFVVCDKVEKGDKVVFFRSNEDGTEWEQEAKTLDRFGSMLLIVQVPPYTNPHRPASDEKQEIHVKLRLTRPRQLEGRIWNTFDFRYFVDPVSTKRKRLLPLLKSMCCDTSPKSEVSQSPQRLQPLEPWPGPSRQISCPGLPYHQPTYTPYQHGTYMWPDTSPKLEVSQSSQQLQPSEPRPGSSRQISCPGLPYQQPTYTPYQHGTYMWPDNVFSEIEDIDELK